MAEAVAPREIAAERRPGAGLDSTATRARRGLAAGGLRATRTYRPSLLCWLDEKPTDALIGTVRGAALAWDPRSLVVSVDGRSQALLVAEDSWEGPSRKRVQAAVHSVVEAVHAVRPGAEIHAVVGERITSRERLPVELARLARLARYARARGREEVVSARRVSLASLLETLDPRDASAFVEGQLGGLRAHDREHGTNLQRVLELGLDYDNRNEAARAAFMHRNTFRRQLGKALDLIDVDLSCPEERLALHVALKMRSLDSGVV
jgi:DNA-binding PucR family transcriptional regulator